MVKYVAPLVGQGGYAGAFAGIPLTAACGLVLAIIWRHSIAALVAKPFTSLYDGGDTPPDPVPTYSTARARQKQGRFQEAVAEIRAQLLRFPTDVEGQLLLAEVQAEGLKDLESAEQTILTFCAQPGHAQKNLAFALYSMADWHLKIAHDSQAARRCLQRIVDHLPDTEFSLGAAQRIAHLASPELRFRLQDPKKFVVPDGVRQVGLRQDQQPVKPPEEDPAQLAADYVRHLERHPLDSDAREKLAVLYADHYHRLDLAADQLEQLITQPNQPGRLVVHWLNLLADLQVRCGVDIETVRATLQRIIDRDPALAAAEVTRRRMELLKLEFKALEVNQDVKMGTYEQNIGLKHARDER